jgi:hypothetical protein
MKNWNSKLSAPWRPNSPASEAAIEALQVMLSFQLSEEYLDLLRWANGGEGQIGNVYLSIWPAEAVVRLNKGYLIWNDMPTVLAIADDSSHFYGFDYSKSVPEVIRFPVGVVITASAINARESSLEGMLDGLKAKRLF